MSGFVAHEILAAAAQPALLYHEHHIQDTKLACQQNDFGIRWRILAYLHRMYSQTARSCNAALPKDVDLFSGHVCMSAQSHAKSLNLPTTPRAHTHDSPSVW